MAVVSHSFCEVIRDARRDGEAAESRRLTNSLVPRFLPCTSQPQETVTITRANGLRETRKVCFFHGDEVRNAEAQVGKSGQRTVTVPDLVRDRIDARVVATHAHGVMGDRDVEAPQRGERGYRACRWPECGNRCAIKAFCERCRWRFRTMQLSAVAAAGDAEALAGAVAAWEKRQSVPRSERNSPAAGA